MEYQIKNNFFWEFFRKRRAPEFYNISWATKTYPQTV